MIHCIDDTYIYGNPLVNCGDPTFAMDVVVEPFISTIIGSRVFYKCQLGLQPQERITSVCEGDKRWHPDPATLKCEGKMCHALR